MHAFGIEHTLHWPDLVWLLYSTWTPLGNVTVLSLARWRVYSTGVKRCSGKYSVVFSNGQKHVLGYSSGFGPQMLLTQDRSSVQILRSVLQWLRIKQVWSHFASVCHLEWMPEVLGKERLTSSKISVSVTLSAWKQAGLPWSHGMQLWHGGS